MQVRNLYADDCSSVVGTKSDMTRSCKTWRADVWMQIEQKFHLSSKPILFWYHFFLMKEKKQISLCTSWCLLMIGSEPPASTCWSLEQDFSSQGSRTLMRRYPPGKFCIRGQSKTWLGLARHGEQLCECKWSKNFSCPPSPILFWFEASQEPQCRWL